MDYSKSRDIMWKLIASLGDDKSDTAKKMHRCEIMLCIFCVELVHNIH